MKKTIDLSGFDITFDFRAYEGVRIVEGEESELMYMILRWS